MSSLVSIVESALASVAVSVPDAVLTLSHGAETGAAICSTSLDMSSEDASMEGAIEKRRVIVTASEFPTISKNAVVYIDDAAHMVTSMKTDPIGASMTIGLSAQLTNYSASVSAVRGESTNAFTVGVLAVCNGLADVQSEIFSQTDLSDWTLIVAAEDWPMESAPTIGDEFQFEKDGGVNSLHVTQADKREGRYILAARGRKSQW